MAMSAFQKVVWALLLLLIAPIFISAFVLWSILGALFTMPLVLVAAGGLCVMVVFYSLLLSSDATKTSGIYLIDWPLVFTFMSLALSYSRNYKTTQLGIVLTAWIYLALRASLSQIDGDHKGYWYGMISVSAILPIFLLENSRMLWRPIDSAMHEEVERRLYGSHLDVNNSGVKLFKVAGLGTVHAPYRGNEAEAKTIVLMHGFAAGNGFFALNFYELSKHFDVYGIEWPGCGRSDRPAFNMKDYDKADAFMVQAIEQWRSEMNLDSFIICGHSMGALFTSSYALQYPHRVQHLILISPVGVGRQPPPGNSTRRLPIVFRVSRQLWKLKFTPMSVIRFAGPFGPRLLRVILEKRISWMPENSALRDGRLNVNDICEYTYQNWAAKPSGELALHTHLLPGAWAKNPLCDMLLPGSLQVPISFIYGGAHDWMDSDQGQMVVNKLLDNQHYAHICRVPKSGHQVFLDNPKMFNRMFVEMIQKYEDHKSTGSKNYGSCS